MSTRRSVVAVVVAGILAAACTDGDSGAESGTTLPDRTGSPTTTPSTASSSPTPTDPTAALEAEITAFFEEYIATVNESWTSTEALARRRTMFADSCAACLAGYGFAERVHAENLRFEGGPATVNDVQLTSSSEGLAVFLAVVDTPAGMIVDLNGTSVQDFDPAIGRQTVYQATRGAQGEFVIISSESL